MRQILVIDDSRFQRTFAKLALEEMGYQVIEAAGGADGIEQARAGTAACILLDLHMPDMSGMDVLRRLRDESCQIPVIVMTAEEDTDPRDQCLALGAAAVIDKPQDSKQLVHSVQTVLEGRA